MNNKDDILFHADEILGLLPDNDIKKNICDKIVNNKIKKNPIYNTNETKDKAKKDYDLLIKDILIKDIRYFDIRDFKYWVWMHAFVCIFFIVEALIMSLFDMYRTFINFTLAFIFLLVVSYLYILVWSNKPISLFRNSTSFIALGIFVLHYMLVLFNGCSKSIFLPGLLLLTTTILGLPRDNRNAFNNISGVIISALTIAIFFMPATIFNNHNIDQTQVVEEKLGLWVSVWILVISILITIRLRYIGSKKIINEE